MTASDFVVGQNELLEEQSRDNAFGPYGNLLEKPSDQIAGAHTFLFHDIHQ